MKGYYLFLLIILPVFGECYFAKLNVKDSSIRTFVNEKIYLKAERLRFGEEDIFLETDNSTILPISFVFKDNQGWFTIAPIVEDGFYEKVILLCKTSEEWKEKRNEHVKEAVEKAIEVAAEIAGSVAAVELGQMGIAGAGMGIAAMTADSAVNECKKAYNCHKEAQRELERESSERVSDNGFPGSRDSDAYDNAHE